MFEFWIILISILVSWFWISNLLIGEVKYKQSSKHSIFKEEYYEYHHYTFPLWHAIILGIIILIPGLNIAVILVGSAILGASIISNENKGNIKLSFNPKLVKILSKPLINSSKEIEE